MSLCSMPECRTEQQAKKKLPVKVFTFPKNPVILECWIHNINRPYWKITSNDKLCANHFLEDDFIVIQRTCTRRSKHKLQELKKTAVPTVFTHLPKNFKYLTRHDLKLKLKIVAEREAELIIIKRERDDFVMTFEDFKAQVKTKLNLENYYFYESDDKCIFCLIENSNEVECMITVHISVNSSLKIRILIGDSEDDSHFERLRIPNKKLIKWSQMENLLNAYRDGATKGNTTNLSYECMLKRAVQCLKLSKSNTSYLGERDRLDIIINQLEFIAKLPKKHFNSGTLKMAFLLFSHSHSIVDVLGEILYLPSRSTIRRLASNMGISTNFNIVTRKDRDLSDPENYVALIIDEIYIDRELQYNDEKIIGTAILNPKHDPKTLLLDTTTVLTFTIKSIFGNLHEIAHMSPSIYPFGDVVYSHTKDALDYVQNLGFNVKLLLADTSNNSQRIFARFNHANHYFTNPIFPDHQIYFQFDVLHVLKDIRSDWLKERVFMYPDIESFKIKTALLADLESLLESDEMNNVESVPKLTKAALNPMVNTRHNVTLVENIFNESTILALREHNKNDTADFCETIKKWWDILVTNDPILLCTDHRFRFLEKFCKWIEAWRMSINNQGRLNLNTYYAIDVTTKTLLELINFSFLNCQAEFLQLAKLQKGSLENRYKFYKSKKIELTENSNGSNMDEIGLLNSLNKEIDNIEDNNLETYKFNVIVNCGLPTNI